MRAPALPLEAPWRLYIAIAGSHQIWSYEPRSRRAAPFVGTGYERCVDGPAGAACFAQRSGLALAGDVLYVADSEVSSIRAIRDLHGRAEVTTGSAELFGFGDRHGVGANVLLQHLMGVAVGAGAVYVADTFNHKVKRVDPQSGECRTLFGNSEPERLPELVEGKPLADAPAHAPAFFEPEGLAYREGELLVADTNINRTVAVRLVDGARRVVLGG